MYINRRQKRRKLKLKSKKRFRKAMFISLIFVAFILLMGLSYEKIGQYNDSKKYLSAGKMVNVNNHKINVFTKGEGNVTVVFTGGLNEPSSYAQFYPLYNVISKHAKIAVYDRPGHGWSEITDVPRDIDSMVKEMHTALIESGQKPPYILVGHSKIVSGQNNLKLLPDDLKQLYLAMTVKIMFNKNIIDEGKLISDNAKIVLDDGKLGNIPLRILTAESNTIEIPEWENSQIAFKEWSKDSKQMVVKGSRHSIHQFSPDIINNEIIKLIKKQK